MNWIKFEKPRNLKEQLHRIKCNVYFAENRSAALLGLLDKQEVKEK